MKGIMRFAAIGLMGGSLLLGCASDETGSDPTTGGSFDDAVSTGDVVTVDVGDGINATMVYANSSDTDINVPAGSSGGYFILTDKFFIGKYEVTYKQWKAVYDWATSASRGSAKYTFGHAGVKGNDGAAGKSDNHPVTTITWRDAMVWCNALTEYYNAFRGGTDLTCAYYTDGAYTTPIRTSTATGPNTYSTAGTQDFPYIKAALADNTDESLCTATGFRLPIIAESEYCARYQGSNADHSVAGYADPYFTAPNYLSGASTYHDDTTGSPNYAGKAANDLVAVYKYYWNGSSWVDNGSSGTAVVGSKTGGANTLGIYDMSGNVWEFCFNAHTYATSRAMRGGGWGNDSVFLIVDTTYSGDVITECNAYVGFRIVKTR